MGEFAGNIFGGGDVVDEFASFLFGFVELGGFGAHLDGGVVDDFARLAIGSKESFWKDSAEVFTFRGKGK